MLLHSLCYVSHAWPGKNNPEIEDCDQKAMMGDCEAEVSKIFMRDNCPESCRSAFAKGKSFQSTYQNRQQAMGKKGGGGVYSFYDLSAKRYGEDGKEIDFERFEGYVTIVVDELSLCLENDTKKVLEDLMKLRRTYKFLLDLVIFPLTALRHPDGHVKCREKGILEDLVQLNESMDFLLMEEIVIHGSLDHPVYAHLKDRFMFKDLALDYPTYFVISPDGDVTVHEDLSPLDLIGAVQYASSDLNRLDEL